MTTLDEIGAKLEAGVSLSGSEMATLVETDDLLGLGAMADEHRRRRHGATTTFVRVQSVSLDGEGGPRLETLETAAEAGEIRLVGEVAEPREAVDAVRTVVAEAGDIPVSAFALEGLAAICDWQTEALGSLLAELRAAGLGLVAEAGADALPGPEWLEVVGRAGLRVGRLTVGSADEHGGVDLVTRIAAWGAAAAPVHAFAPLSRVPAARPSTGYRDLRQVALARLLVDNIDAIQVDWALYGPKLAQVALMFGADDIDAVSPYDTPDLGWRRTAREEITRNILASALTPAERNGRFEILGA